MNEIIKSLKEGKAENVITRVITTYFILNGTRYKFWDSGACMKTLYRKEKSKWVTVADGEECL